MIEDESYKRISRRTRGERTKRRERYLLSSANTNKNNVLSTGTLASSTESLPYSVENNNSFTWHHSRIRDMGNNLLVDMF